MEPNALLLARLQFAFTTAVHIVFPAFTIGSSAYVATLLVLWRRTGHDHFHRLARFWTKIFAVSFAMGVVSGIPLSYEFGTNWSRFSEVVGNVVGPLIGYEVLTAFFLEATFLGVMLFGWKGPCRGARREARYCADGGSLKSTRRASRVRRLRRAALRCLRGRGRRARSGCRRAEQAWLQVLRAPLP